MSFWDLFWPMFAAQMAVILLVEGVNFGMGLWVAKKQAAHYQKMHEEMMKLYPNGLPVQDFGMGGFSMPMMMPVGEKPAGDAQVSESGTGQYL